MSQYSKKENPRYIKISIDIARKIYRGEFPEGCKLKGRSTLAAEYNVSPETIRRSMALLQDMNVVKVYDKSGIRVLSKANAKQFIEQFKMTNTLNSILNNIKDLFTEKNKIENEIIKNVELLVQDTIYFRDMDVMEHYKETIFPNSHLIDKSIDEIKFWQNTKATIIAIIRDGNTTLSPGPYFKFKQGDIVCFISEDDNVYSVKEYINKYE